MKPETADYLDKARTCLADARQIATLPLPRLAAREAYYAAFHAAEAYIFEHTGKVATTHRGVRSEFARLARREPQIDRELTRFLATAYQLKATADYGIGPSVAPITADQATAAITSVRHSRAKSSTMARMRKRRKSCNECGRRPKAFGS
jgi:uncharacterized protein (UPF0332 family)